MDSGHILVNMGLINNIGNETITLWQTIIKASASTTSDANTEVGDNVADTDNFIQLHPIQIGTEFLPTLSDDI